MTKLSRILLALASVILLGAFVFPLWRIDLIAPQYPEGLGMLIRVNTVTGIKPNDLQNINGLNHYIGMKAIQPDAIPELRVMPWIVAGLTALGLIAAALGNRRLLYGWLGSFVALGIAGLYDFWRWTYDYGHNLDYEHAIIKVPGMTYQPPLIGTKQLLNFTATSWPDVGTLCLGVAFGLALAALIIARRVRTPGRTATIALAAAASACTPAGPRAIMYDRDTCDYCRMTISDERFGGQFVTSKGKVHVFDSIECLAAFVLVNGSSADSGRAWVTDFAKPGRWHPAERAVFVHGGKQSPMGLNIVSFGPDADTASISQDSTARIMMWSSVLELVRRDRLASTEQRERRVAAR